MESEMDSLARDWYHLIGHMAGDIELAMGTEPMSINWQHWLSIPLWTKEEAVLLVCGLEPNEFHQVKSYRDYLSMCKPFIELLQRTLEESNTPFDWLIKFKDDGYLDCAPRGIHEWLTQQIEQSQLKPKAVGDTGMGSNKKKRVKGEADRLRTTHFIDWVSRTNYEGKQTHYYLQDELRQDNPDLWGSNEQTFNKWLQTSEATPAKELLDRLKLEARQAV